MSNNLETIFCMATKSELNQGKHWYSDTREYLQAMGKRFDVPLKVTAGIAAALSPRLNWNSNVFATIAILRNRRVKGLKGNIKKAQAIKRTGIVMKYLKGPKVTSFFLNIIGNESEVTIDTLMINCFKNSFVKPSITKDERTEMVDTIEKIARARGLTPAQVQAIIWVTWHRVTKSNFPGYVSFLKLF